MPREIADVVIVQESLLQSGERQEVIQAVVRGMNRAVVRSINEVAREMGKQTIAEFVESRDILAELETMGVDYGQGFGIERPHPLKRLIGD